MPPSDRRKAKGRTMGRIPCCEKDNVKRGQWTPEEDNKLSSYIAQHGTRNWRLVPKNAGLQRCGKSCRLRWTNYLRPDLNHGEFSESEEQTIVKLHSVLGNRWSLIAAQLTGRTDNDVKNHWNTKLKKKLSGMGIDPVTHKPFSHLMAEIATTLAPPQVTHLAEAALGCFKDEMLHLLTKRRVDFCSASAAAAEVQTYPTPGSSYVQKIKFGHSQAYAEDALMCDVYPPADGRGFGYEGEGSAWSACTGGGCGAADPGEENGGEESKSGIFGSECVLWDLSDELMNNIV